MFLKAHQIHIMLTLACNLLGKLYFSVGAQKMRGSLLELISFKAELRQLSKDWEMRILALSCSLLLNQEIDGLHTVLTRT